MAISKYALSLLAAIALAPASASGNCPRHASRGTEAGTPAYYERWEFLGRSFNRVPKAHIDFTRVSRIEAEFAPCQRYASASLLFAASGGCIFKFRTEYYRLQNLSRTKLWCEVYLHFDVPRMSSCGYLVEMYEFLQPAYLLFWKICISGKRLYW